jgi:uncharacterized ferritin-like protein (DUF455 family)
MPLPPVIKKDTFINGLPNGVSPAEENKLWLGSSQFRPKDQKRWLSHLISLEFGLARLTAGWVPGCGHLEWKIELPRMMFEQMQRVRRLRERLQELPGGSAEIKPVESLERWLVDLGQADSGPSFFRVLFHQVYPALAGVYSEHIKRCDTVFDAPTLYLLNINAPEIDRAIAWGRNLIATHTLAVEDSAQAEAYQSFVAKTITMCDGLLPTEDEVSEDQNELSHPIKKSPGPNPERRSQDPRLRLRRGFPDSEAGNPTHGTLYELVYHMATEWQVIDPMCEVFFGIPNMPMDFFIDFSRHTWDECRHARMGFRRLEELGYKLTDFEFVHGAERVEVLGDYFAGLTMVGEACSFTRKKGSISYFLKAGDPGSAMLPEVDCVDEQLHVTLGNKWVEKVYEAATGKKKERNVLTVEQRRLMMDEIEQVSPDHEFRAHSIEFLKGLDAKTRDQLVNSFSGFCGLIEFKLDLTVR